MECLHVASSLGVIFYCLSRCIWFKINSMSFIECGLISQFVFDSELAETIGFVSSVRIFANGAISY